MLQSLPLCFIYSHKKAQPYRKLGSCEGNRKFSISDGCNGILERKTLSPRLYPIAISQSMIFLLNLWHIRRVLLHRPLEESIFLNNLTWQVGLRTKIYGGNPLGVRLLIKSLCSPYWLGSFVLSKLWYITSFPKNLFIRNWFMSST